MKKILIILLMVSLIAETLSAQKKHVINGKIADHLSGLPLEYVSVNLYQADSSFVSLAITDGKGRFRFSGITDGYYKLICSFLSYQNQSCDSFEVKGTVDLKEIRLIPLEISLGEATVMSEKNQVDFRPDKQVIQISQQLQASGGTASDVLQVIPSVQVDAAGNVFLRGSSGFLLLIDGRPSILAPAEVLNQIPAASIRSIEVITSPSAKYQAEGNTGIINIITKKNYKGGTEGLIDLSLANGDKYSASLMLNKSSEKFRYYAGFNISDKTKINETWSDRTVFSTETLHEQFNTSRKLRNYLHDFRIGTDFYLNSHNTLSLEGKAGLWQFDRNIGSVYQSDTIAQDMESNEVFSNQNRYLLGSINFKHSFAKKDHELILDAFINSINNKTLNYYSENQLQGLKEIINLSERNEYRFKADYTLPLRDKSMIESGVYAGYKHSAYEYEFNEEFSEADSLNGEMNYSDMNISTYFIFRTELSGFNIQLGLRLENSDRNIETGNGNISLSETGLFPGIHVSKLIKEKHNISFAYNRRINRPDEWQLSPLIYSSDRFSVKSGNPFLHPEFTNAIEMNYFVKNKTSDLSLQFFYRNLRNSITQVFVRSGDIFTETYVNMKETKNAGTEMMFSLQPLKWLRISTGVSAYFSDWSGNTGDGSTLDDRTITMNGNFRSTFSLSKNTSLQFLAIYYAPGYIPQGYNNSFYYFDFILRQQFLDKKLSLTLRTHNTFDTGLYKYTLNGLNYTSDNSYLYEGPTFILSLSYKINNFKAKEEKKVEIDFDSGLDH